MIRNWPAEQAFWWSAVAAATFAGHHEAFRQARDDMWPTRREVVLREAVEELVGPNGGPPPPLSAIPEKVGGVRIERRVHAQAWRSHLAANASRLTLV